VLTTGRHVWAGAYLSFGAVQAGQPAVEISLAISFLSQAQALANLGQARARLRSRARS
jgi:hypothetical protein